MESITHLYPGLKGGGRYFLVLCCYCGVDEELSHVFSERRIYRKIVHYEGKHAKTERCLSAVWGLSQFQNKDNLYAFRLSEKSVRVMNRKSWNCCGSKSNKRLDLIYLARCVPLTGSYMRNKTIANESRQRVRRMSVKIVRTVNLSAMQMKCWWIKRAENSLREETRFSSLLIFASVLPIRNNATAQTYSSKSITWSLLESIAANSRGRTCFLMYCDEGTATWHFLYYVMKGNVVSEIEIFSHNQHDIREEGI